MLGEQPRAPHFESLKSDPLSPLLSLRHGQAVLSPSPISFGSLFRAAAIACLPAINIQRLNTIRIHCMLHI